MQTFLPYPSFEETAKCLDYRRLGKQRVEAYQILEVITGKSSGWINHPAVKMWKGYESSLALYGWVICDAWVRQGYNDTLRERFETKITPPITAPDWIGDERFHLSHQSNLVRKDHYFYSRFFPNVPANLPYYWPV